MEANDIDGASCDYEGIVGVTKNDNDRGTDDTVHKGNFAQGVDNEICPGGADTEGKVDEGTYDNHKGNFEKRVDNDIRPSGPDTKGKVDEGVNNDTRSIAHDRKRKVEEEANDSCSVVFERPAKRMYLPSTRPSRGQIRNLVLHEHKSRLIRLLRQLVREHNWKQASGVVSALLKGTENSPPLVQRRKNWAAMEILSQMKGLANNERKIKNLYESWMTKHGLRKYLRKKKYMIQLEYAIFCCMQGNILDANNNVKCLVQETESGADPVVKLMAGLMCYQLWYSDIPKVMQLNSQTSLSSETCGVNCDNGLCPKAEPFNYTHDCKSIQFQDTKISLQHDSEESIGNKGKRPMDIDGDVPPKQSQEVFPELKFYQRGSHEISEPQAAHNQNNLMDGDISFPYGLDVSLLPICWQQSTEDIDNYYDYLDKSTSRGNYADAVMHLKDALYSTPSSMAALLPLIQLLLLNDKAEEALEELKKYCDKSNAVLPFRLRAKILECFGGKYHAMLPTWYEDTLKKDPRCLFSLSGLISLYKTGSYNVELLVGMIALHLDATYATFDIWGELASCFLELQALVRCPYEEDQMSTTRGMYDDDDGIQMWFTPNRIPEAFAKGQERKVWSLRCRWWATRHFSKNAYISEKQAGDWQLLTFKAACASHLYDEKFEYVRSVNDSLEENNDMERLSFLQMHFQRSIKLLRNLNVTT